MKAIEVSGGGLTKRPEMFLLFHRVVENNITLDRSWTGPRHPIVGKTGAWKMLHHLEIIDEDLHQFVQDIQRKGWSPERVTELYQRAADAGLYITAFIKSLTDIDSRIVNKYRAVLFDEIEKVRPKQIIVFGAEASRYVFQGNKPVVAFSTVMLTINQKSFNAHVLPYPVGRARRLLKSTLVYMRHIVSRSISDASSRFPSL